jgi:hypothetical protein
MPPTHRPQQLMIIKKGERIRCSGSIFGKLAQIALIESCWSKCVVMPWDCGMQLRLVLVRDKWTWRCSVVGISCLTALCFWNLAVCTLVRILLTIQRQESWLKEWKTTYPRPRHAMPRGPIVSRFHRPSQFASQFRDCVGAFNSLRDVTTPPTLSIRFAISRLRRWSQFASRLRGVGALKLLHDVATRPIELRGHLQRL